MLRLSQLVRHLEGYLRELLGETAYARYAERVAARSECVPTPEAFYLAELERKYSRPSRCC
jgi:hypothetical protein